jgi:hypothetical protein
MYVAVIEPHPALLGPFAILLLSIAIFPLILRQHWERHYQKLLCATDHDNVRPGGGNFFRRPHLHREQAESADSRDRRIAPRADAGIPNLYY